MTARIFKTVSKFPFAANYQNLYESFEILMDVINSADIDLPTGLELCKTSAKSKQKKVDFLRPFNLAL